MSSFLSNKFLQYRTWQGQSRQIDQDLFCTACGYNVRGLVYGRNCPECGTAIRHTKAELADPLLSGELDERRRLRAGLLLVSLCLFIVAAARLGVIVILFTSIPVLVGRTYVILGMVVSAAWIVGVWLVTDPRFDARYLKLRWIRRIARLTPLLLIPGYFTWWLAITTAAGTNSEDVLRGTSILLRGGAGLGALFLAAWLVRLASDAELEDAAKRMYYAIWMLPLPSLLLALLPDRFPWVALILFAIPLLIWCWYVFAFGRGAFAMFSHINWALRIAADYPHRLNRMHETRSELQSEADRAIRPVRVSHSEDVPLI